MIKLIQRVYDAYMKIYNRIIDNHVFAYAAQASFFVIISAVPFLMIVLSLLQLFISIPREQIVDFVGQIMPNQVAQLTDHIIAEMSQKTSVSLVSISSLTLLWSASRGVRSISIGLQKVYGSPATGNFLRSWALSLLYTLLFMISIVTSIVILLFGRYVKNLLILYASGAGRVLSVFVDLKYLIFWVFLTFLFVAFYKLLAKNSLRLRAHLPGAALGSGGWLLFSYFYSIYINNFSNYSYVYGSMTAIILMMLWIYFCMIMLLLGAQLNFWLYTKGITIKTIGGSIKRLFTGAARK